MSILFNYSILAVGCQPSVIHNSDFVIKSVKFLNAILIFILAGSVFAETVEQLVERLDSPVFSQREDAQQQLLQLGPEIEHFLPDEKNENFSQEVRVRLKNLRRAFLFQSIGQSLDKVRFTLDSLTFQESQSQRTAKITVDWSASAKEIRPIRWRFPLVFLGQNGTYDIPVAPGQTQAPIRFTWKTANGETKKTLHGKCDVLFATAIHPFIFPLSEGAESIIRRENVVVSVQRAVYDRRTRQLKIRFLAEYDDALDAMQSHLIWMESNLAYLQGENEQTIFPDGPVQQVEKSGNRFAGIFSFRIPQETPWRMYRFIYQTPTVLAEKTVEFRLPSEIDRQVQGVP